MTGLNLAQNVLTSYFAYNQIYYDLTLAYRNELYLLDFFVNSHTPNKYMEKKSYVHFHAVCGSLAPLSGGDLKFYKDK